MVFWIVVASLVALVLVLGARSDLRRRRLRRAGSTHPNGARNKNMMEPAVQHGAQMNHGVGDFRGR